MDIYKGETPRPAVKQQQPNDSFSTKLAPLCVPDAAQSLGHTHIICLKLVETDGSGESEGAQEPVAEGVGLGHTLGAEVVNDSGPDSID